MYTQMCSPRHAMFDISIVEFYKDVLAITVVCEVIKSLCCGKLW